MGVASLVLGIIGLLLSFVPCIGMYGVILTIPGVIFGAIGISKAGKANQPKGLAIAGLVLSIIGTVIAIWWYVAVTKAADHAQEFGEALDQLSAELQKSQLQK